MRLLRFSRSIGFLLLSALALASCSGNQQGYYSACDEPAGLAVGCPLEPDAPDGVFTAWEACLKLASCGVVLLDSEEDNACGPRDNENEPFACCVQEVSLAEEDYGDTVLACIEQASCPELAATVVQGDPDPNPANGSIEGVIGWCGRLDP